MGRVNADYHEKQGISNIFTLTNVVTNESVALIPSDTEGNLSWSGITKAPLTRNAMQTTSSSGEWSDLEYPWQAIQQEDWAGGRANLRFSTDKSRFFDSKRAQTAFNSCIYNAPLEYYSDGSIARAVSTNCPDSLYWEKVSGPKKYITVKFICGTITSAGEVYIHLRRRGTPTSPLVVELCSGLSSPTILATHSYTTSEITDTLAEFRKFTFDTVTLTATNTYYVRVHCDEATADDYWQVGCNKTSADKTFISSDGTNFTGATFEMFYRVSIPQTDQRCKFFTYEQLQFCVRQQGENGIPTLLLNGEIGKATGGTGTTITETGKSWTTDQWKGARIGLVYSTGSQEHVSCWKTIESNTSDTITVDSDWTVNPASGTVYIINDTPLWQTITGHGLTAHVTDIHVISGTVYFAQGDYVAARKMRWHNGAFEFKELTGIYATFLQSVRDSQAMMLWRARNDGIAGKRTVDRSVLLDWETSATSWTAIETALVTSDDRTQVSSAVTNGSTVTTTTSIGGTNVQRVTVSDSNGTKTTTTEVLAHNPLRTSVATESKDFTTCDYDSKEYEISITNFSSENNTGSCVIMLQESEDGNAWFDVQSVSAKSAGKYYIHAHCQFRYRRFVITATGTNCTVNNISITTSQIPHFLDPVILQDNYGKITRLFEYGAEQEKSLWVFQEGMVSSINKTGTVNATYHLDRINLDELQTTAEQHNGNAVGTSDVYLMFGWLNGLQRFYNTQLEGKGYDHDEGLPEDMRGRVTQILSYPSNSFVSVDAGPDGYSSVMLFNGNGWHNIYKAPNKGERIWDIGFQPIYGDRPDRMWINIGDDIIWLAMPSKVIYALHDPNAEYTHESVVTSAWITGGMAEVNKLWQSLSIMADYIDGVNCWIEADYQLDDEDAWHPIPNNPYMTSPQQEEEFASETESINGKKLRYRLRLQTTDKHKTPKVNVVLIKALGKVDVKFSYSFSFRNIKWKPDLMGEYEDIEPYELDYVLNQWANELATLRLNSAYKIFDGKKVFLDAVQTSVVKEKSEGYLGMITLTEI